MFNFPPKPNIRMLFHHITCEVSAWNASIVWFYHFVKKMWKSFPLLGISDSSEMPDLAGMEKETVKRDSCENKENISTIFSRNK